MDLKTNTVIEVSFEVKFRSVNTLKTPGFEVKFKKINCELSKSLSY